MGMIRIQVVGSFGESSAEFAAMKTGHADCVAQAIEWLAKDVLPKAIENDHRCHTQGIFPEVGFGKRGA
jgi:hypothetical protein